MNTANISPPDRSAIAQAVALLAGAANAVTTADTALLCLAASEQLRELGVDREPAPVQPNNVRQALNETLGVLAGLPPNVFGLAAVLNASSHVRRAQQLIS
jgi:hypothetical protein